MEIASGEREARAGHCCVTHPLPGYWTVHNGSAIIVRAHVLGHVHQRDCLDENLARFTSVLSTVIRYELNNRMLGLV